MRARLACVAAMAVIVASCGASTTPSPTASPTSTASGHPTPTTVPTTATPAIVGHWETAGTMAIGRFAPHAVPLADGSALAVGNDACQRDYSGGCRCTDCVRDDSVATETWDPSTSSWSMVASLNKPRADFAAVPLADGRVLVTGGVNAGVSHGGWPYQSEHQSYSSTYIYDPTHPSDGWTKAALLDTARTDPLAAVLPDGRVLVAGGYYLSGETGRIDTGSETVLAAYRSPPVTEPMPGGAILADTGPGPTLVPALATAELYDPATDLWSAAGSMRYARYGSEVITLADGRVLIVGSWSGYPGWNESDVTIDERVHESAEVYDPHTGRFSLTESLPPIDWSPLSQMGLSSFSDVLRSPGTLVALADGGALLVGRTSRWYAEPPGAHVRGTLVRTLRFDPRSGRWTEIDRSLDREDSTTRLIVQVIPGHVSHNAVASMLADGRVLVAGGERDTCGSVGLCGETYVAIEAASLYDPATDVWTALPPMPEPRAGGVAVTLTDGSVLIVGGYNETLTFDDTDCETQDQPTGLASAVRFVPGQ